MLNIKAKIFSFKFTKIAKFLKSPSREIFKPFETSNPKLKTSDESFLILSKQGSNSLSFFLPNLILASHVPKVEPISPSPVSAFL